MGRLRVKGGKKGRFKMEKEEGLRVEKRGKCQGWEKGEGLRV
jgi:hypothetical protein